MRKRILSLLMTVAITLTFSMPMSVFAASASLTLEEAKWTAEDEITVKFGQNVSVSDDGAVALTTNKTAPNKKRNRQAITEFIIQLLFACFFHF